MAKSLTSEEAEAAKLEALHLIKGGMLTTKDPKFSEWGVWWLEGKTARAKVGQLKPHTVEGYSLNIEYLTQNKGKIIHVTSNQNPNLEYVIKQY